RVAELIARRLVDRHRDGGRRRIASVPRMEHERFRMLALGRQFRSPSGIGQAGTLPRVGPPGVGSFEMTPGIPKRSRFTWLAVALAAASIIAVVVVVGELWDVVGDSEISLAGALAMIFGVVIAPALGIGLMSLAFPR